MEGSYAHTHVHTHTYKTQNIQNDILLKRTYEFPSIYCAFVQSIKKNIFFGML